MEAVCPSKMTYLRLHVMLQLRRPMSVLFKNVQQLDNIFDSGVFAMAFGTSVVLWNKTLLVITSDSLRNVLLIHFCNLYSTGGQVILADRPCNQLRSAP